MEYLLIDVGILVALGWIAYDMKLQLKNQRKQIADLHNAVQGENASEISEYEAMKAERDSLFDARIEQMKSELAEQQAPRQGVVADELHPNVKNIEPRETDINRKREVEIAE